jgi:hypothetical protein
LQHSKRNTKSRRTKKLQAKNLASPAKAESYCTLPGRLQFPRKGKANAEALKGGKPTRHELLPEDKKKVDHALWETSKAATLASSTILDEFFTVLASLPASLVSPEGASLPQESRKILLFNLWITVENHPNLSPSFVIAKGTDTPEARCQKVEAALEDILAGEGLGSVEIQEWLNTLRPTISADINPSAMFVNRKAMAKVGKNGSAYGMEDALDLIDHYYGGFSAMAGLFEPEGTGGLKNLSIPQLTSGLFSNRFGTGEGADYETLSSIYFTIREWAIKALEDILPGPTAIAEDTTGPPLSGLLDRLFSVFPVLYCGFEKGNETRMEALRRFLSRNNHKSDTQVFLGGLAKNAGPITEEDLLELVDLSDKNTQLCSKSIGKRGQKNYLGIIMATAEQNCGVPFSPSGQTRYFYENAISNAYERLHGHLAQVGLTECKRRALALEGAKELAQCSEKAITTLDQFCAKQKLITGSKGAYNISRREGNGYQKLYYLWAKKGCNTAEKRLMVLNQQKGSFKGGSITLFRHLCGTTSLSGDPMAGFNPLSDLTPRDLRAYINARYNLSRATSNKIPMLKHFHPILSPATLRFGCGQMEVYHYAKNHNSQEDPLSKEYAQYIVLTLWDSISFKTFQVFWESRRVSSALGLYSRDSKNIVPLATDLGRLSAGLPPDAPCEVDGLYSKLPNWPITIMADKVFLDKVARNTGARTPDGTYEYSRLNLSCIRWNINFHIKTQGSGPYLRLAQDNNLELKGALGMPVHPENGSSRGSGVQIQLSRLPEGIRVMGIDLGARTALACSIGVTCSKETVEGACLEAGYPLPEEKDLYCHIKTNVDGVKKTTIFRRTGPDFLPGGLKNPSPWIKLESQFTLKLPGEFEGDKRELGNDEMLFINRVETELGIPQPYLQRLFASGYGQSDKFPGQKSRLSSLLEKSPLELPPLSQGEGPVDISLEKVNRDAITAFSDLLFTIRKSLDGLFSLRKVSELLKDRSEANTTQALMVLFDLVGCENGIGSYAGGLWDSYLTVLPGYQTTFSAKIKDESHFNSLAALLLKSSLLGELYESLEEELHKTEIIIGRAINQIHVCLFPSEAPKKHRPFATSGNYANMHMGGLSLERLNTLSNFVFKLMRPFAQYSATYITCTQIAGESPSSPYTIGLKELHKVNTLRKERHNLLANLVLSAALGGYRDKFNPKGIKQAPDPSKAIHIIAIEELSSLKPSLDRTRRENKVISSMKASGFKDVLMEGCQRYGVKLVQVWPAETSRIDSRTGSFGIRVQELTALKFMTQDWIRKCVQEARERRENGSPSPGDDLWISTYDNLRGLSRSQLSKAKNVFIPSKGGPLFLSVSPDSLGAVNADLNASFNIAIRPFMDPDWEGSHYKVTVDSKSVPDNGRYKGCLVIAKGQKLLDEGLKREDPGVEAEGGKYYLWRLPSGAPIDKATPWLRTWDFFAKVNEMAAKKLLKSKLPACSGSGFDP